MERDVCAKSLIRSSHVPSRCRVVSVLRIDQKAIGGTITRLMGRNILVRIRKGKAFIGGRGITCPLNRKLLSFTRSLRDRGVRFAARIVASQVRPTGHCITRGLEVAPNRSVLCLRHLHSVNSRGTVLVRGHVGVRLYPNVIRVSFGRRGLFPAVRDLSGEGVHCSRDHCTTQLVNGRHNRFLSVDRSTPILRLRRLIFFSQRLPIRFNGI